MPTRVSQIILPNSMMCLDGFQLKARQSACRPTPNGVSCLRTLTNLGTIVTPEPAFSTLVTMAGHNSDPPSSRRQQGGGVWRQTAETRVRLALSKPGKAAAKPPPSSPVGSFQVALSAFREHRRHRRSGCPARREGEPACALPVAACLAQRGSGARPNIPCLHHPITSEWRRFVQCPRAPDLSK